jgi:hypothetical protein
LALVRRWELGRLGVRRAQGLGAAGQPGEVVGYYRQRGGRVAWVQVPSRLHYASHPLTGSAAELHAAVDALDASSPDAAPMGLPAAG